MAKTFKRTLIATLSVLCLLALSLFAAACSPATNAYKVTLDYESEKGEVTLDPVQDTYDAGSDVTVTVTPKPNYEVGTFKVDGKDEQLTNGKYTFAVEKDTVVAVTFTQKITTEDQYSITVTPTQNGTVLLSDPGPVASGTEITATVTPAPGYELDTAKVNGADVTVDGNNRFKFTVTADTTVTVTFKEVPVTKYNVSAAATQNGTVSLDHEGEVAENTEVTVTIAPATGYELDTAKVNTTDVTSQVRDNTFKFTVTEDTVVTVTFKSTTPPAPPLDIDEKWVGTYTGVHNQKDYRLEITTTSFEFYEDDVKQDITVTVNADDFTVVWGDLTLTAEASYNGVNDDGSVFSIDFRTDDYSFSVTLIDEEKAPPEPPLGEQISKFPPAFTGTWYALYNTDDDTDVLYTIVIDDTTMTITVGDGSPTTINVADVLYNAHEGSMWEDPTLYFTYNGTEESKLELGYSDELNFISGDINVYGFTHDMPERPYGNPTAFLTSIEGTYVNGTSRIAIYNASVTTFVIRGEKIDFTVRGMDPDNKDVLVIEDTVNEVQYRITKDGDDLAISGGMLDDVTFTKQEEVHVLPAEFYGKWYRPADTDCLYEVAADGTVKFTYGAGFEPNDVDVVGVGGVYTLDGSVATLTDDNTILVVTGDDRVNYYYKEGLTPTLPAELVNTTWFGTNLIETVSFYDDNISIGSATYYVYHINDDGSFNAYAAASMYSFTYSDGLLTCNGEELTEEGSGDIFGEAYNGTFTARSGAHTLTIADGVVSLDGTEASDLAYDSDEDIYHFTVDETVYTLTYVVEPAIFTLTEGAATDLGYFVRTVPELPTAIENASSYFGSYLAVNNEDETDTLTIINRSTDTLSLFTIGKATKVEVVWAIDLSDEDAQFVEYMMFVDGEFAIITFSDYDNSYMIGTKSYTLEALEGRVISPKIQGVWVGSDTDHRYRVELSAQSAKFWRSGMVEEFVTGTLEITKTDGLAFTWSISFHSENDPGREYSYTYTVTYNSKDDTIKLYEYPNSNIILSREDLDKDTIPEVYIGKWDVVNAAKIVGKLDITGKTITLTLNGREYDPVTIVEDDVVGYTVTFLVDGDEYQLSPNVDWDGETPGISGYMLGKANGAGSHAIVGNLYEEGTFKGYTVPESVKGDYHSDDNSVTVTVGDTITATIGGKEVTLDIVGLDESSTSVRIDLTSDDGHGYLNFYFGNGDDISASYTFFWQANDAESGKDYTLLVDGEDVEEPIECLADWIGTYKTADGAHTLVITAGSITIDGVVPEGISITAKDGGFQAVFNTYSSVNAPFKNKTTPYADCIEVSLVDENMKPTFYYYVKDGLESLSVPAALDGTYADSGKTHTIVIKNGTIVVDGEERFVYSASETSVLFFYGVGRGGFSINDRLGFVLSISGNENAGVVTFTKQEEVPDHPLAGNYTAQAGNPLSTKNTVAFAITADGTMTLTTSIKTEDVQLTESEGSYTCTINRSPYTVEFTDTFGNDVLVISGKGGTFYAIRDGVGPAVDLNLLLGTWRTADGMHTVDVSADGITYDDVAVYVYGYYKDGDGPNTGYTFISGNTPYNFYSNDGTTATFAKLDAASSTTYTKTVLPIEGLADYVGTYKTLDEAHTVVVTETGITVDSVALTEITVGSSAGVYTAKKGTASCTVKLYDRYVNIGSEYYIKDGEVSLTVDSQFDGTYTGTGISTHSEYTFVIKEGKVTLNGKEAFVLGVNSSSFELLFTAGHGRLLMSTLTYNSYSPSDEVRLVKVIEGGGDDGVVEVGAVDKSFQGNWTGTDGTGRTWTVTATATTIKIEIDGTVQTLTDVQNYKWNGIEFKIGSSSYTFSNWGGSVSIHCYDGDEGWTVTLTKA